MENTVVMFFINRTKRYQPSLPLVLSRSTIVFAVFAFFFSSPATAQCVVPLVNNQIGLKPAVCSNTVAYLQGTTPVGGNGTYTYQWQSSASGCGGAYSNISGATDIDYMIPASDAPGLCYRRVVTSGAGCTLISLNSILVNAADRTIPAPPTATIIQPTCLIGTGTITVTSPLPGTNISYSINGTTYSNTTGIFTLLPPGTYSLTAKFSTGCISPAAAIILNAPSFPGTVSPTTATICTNGSQVITATPGGTSYLWYRGTTLVATTAVNTYTATQAGTYYAVIVNGLCSTQSSNSSTITTVAPPSGSISPGGNTTVCAGNSVTLTATGGGTYQWYRDGNLTSNTTATFTTNQAGTYSVILSNGVCSASASNTTTVIVEAAPIGTVSPTSASICAGSNQLLAVSGGGTGASYQWYKDNLAISAATASTFSATQAGVYTVDVISSTGCKARSSNGANISVTPLPSGSIAPATVNICSGNSATLTATGGVTYQWYLNGSPISGAFSAAYTANATGQYAVDIFDAGGCKGKSSNEGTVVVAPTPTGSISPATSIVCPGDSVTLSVSGGTSYQWYKDGVLLQGATSATYFAKQAGSYTADIILGICKGNSTNPGNVTLGTIPTGIISPATGSICPGNNVVLTTTASGASSYQWFLNNAPIPNATSATYTATQTGTYTVIIYNSNCKGPASNNAVISPSTAIGFSTASTDPSCTATSGTITVSGTSGGTGNGYTYSKDNGLTFQVASVFNGLTPGTYQIVVKDAAGCKSTPKAVVINTFTSTLQANTATTNITCTQASGTVTATANGGTSPYQYSLDGGAYQTGNSFNSLSVGAHKVTVKDAAGCVYDASFTITQVQSTLAAGSSVTNATCGQPNGAVVVLATGGSVPYTYSLNNGSFQTGASFSVLAVGSYKVTVKDGAGCTYDVNFDVKQLIGIPNLVVTNPPKICPGTTADLQAAAVTIGSDAGLNYTYWKDATVTTGLPTPAAVTEGTYYIKAANSACSSVKPVVVTAQIVFPGSITFTRTTACFTDSLPLTASGGVSYKWYRNDTLIIGATKATYQAKQSGVYSVNISDGTCDVKASNPVKLEFKACTPIFDPRAFVPTAFTPNRNGTNDVLRPIFYNVVTLHYFKVYNRWGQQVFETSTTGKGWDGTKDGVPQPPETYSWILECVGKDGEIIKESGRSFLIR